VVRLFPIPLNIINTVNIIKSKYGLQNYIIHLYKVNFTDRIIGFFEKDKKDKQEENERIQNVFIILWQNECDPNPHQQIQNLKFYYLKNIKSIEILQSGQLDKHNFEFFTPTSANRYVYNLNTHLFKEYEILCGKLYIMSTNSNTEMVYYKDE